MIFPAPSDLHAIYVIGPTDEPRVLYVSLVGWRELGVSCEWRPLVVLQSGRLGSPQEFREQLEAATGSAVYAGVGYASSGTVTLAATGKCMTCERFIAWVSEHADLIDRLLDGRALDSYPEPEPLR